MARRQAEDRISAKQFCNEYNRQWLHYRSTLHHSILRDNNQTDSSRVALAAKGGNRHCCYVSLGRHFSSHSWLSRIDCSSPSSTSF